MKANITIALMFVAFLGLNDELLTMSGKIVDVNGNAVQGAVLVIDKSTSSTSTGPDGEFRIRYFSQGKPVVVGVRRLGFETIKVEVSDDDRENVDLVMDNYIQTVRDSEFSVQQDEELFERLIEGIHGCFLDFDPEIRINSAPSELVVFTKDAKKFLSGRSNFNNDVFQNERFNIVPFLVGHIEIKEQIDCDFILMQYIPQ